MAKVQLKFPASFASMSDAQGSDLLTLEKEVGEEVTIGDLLADLAFSYTDFRKVVFDPDTRKVSDLIHVILNDSLLQHPNTTEAKVNDGDSVIILPMYSGG